MRAHELRRLDRELTEFVDGLLCGMGRPERRENMALYITGLLLDGERKSIEPIAGRLVDDASHVEAMRQRLQQAVSISAWSDAELRRRLALKLERELPSLEAWLVDDTGFAKKGKHSVGVQRQYSGTLGRTDNCQIGVSLHLAGAKQSACIGMRLYLPESWTSDPARCSKAGVPQGVRFQTKLEIAIELVDQALAWGLQRRVVLADAAYGDANDFREALSTRGLPYIVAVKSNHVAWPEESSPHVVARRGRPGRRTTKFKDPDHPPMSLEKLAARVPATQWRRVTWLDGQDRRQAARFVRIPVRLVSREKMRGAPGPKQTLLVEWPAGEPRPTKYYLSTLPPDTSLPTLVRLTKLRWRVERDYQEMKSELGLDHFEGRTWRGFHHHATLVAVAHGFLALRRALFPPEEDELDTSSGPTPSPASPPALDRSLSTLPPANKRNRTAARPIEDVIEWC